MSRKEENHELQPISTNNDDLNRISRVSTPISERGTLPPRGSSRAQSLNSHEIRSLKLKKSFHSRPPTPRSLDDGAQNLENHAALICEKMEQDNDLVEDSFKSAKLRRDTLKRMPQCLTIKRCIKNKLNQKIKDNSKGKQLSCWQNTKYKVGIQYLKVQNSTRGLCYSVKFWYSTLKKIEGQFGSAAASYFKYVRWLFILNFGIFVPIFMFIIGPQIWALKNAQRNDFMRFNFEDIFTAQRFLKNSILFYGFYSNETISIGGRSYNFPLAYFLCMLIVYLFVFVLLSFGVANSYKKSFVETQGGLPIGVAPKIISSWNFGIATREAEVLRKTAIFNELKEILNSFNENNSEVTKLAKFSNFMIKIVAHVIIIFILLGVVIFMNYLLKNENTVLTAILANLIMVLLPPIFSAITDYEDYKNPRNKLLVNVLRNFALNLVVLALLVNFWLQEAILDKECWETRLGQETYRLILFDFIFSTIAVTIFNFASFLIKKYILQKSGLLEFDISSRTLQLIYNQNLFWIGLFFAPLLSFLIILKLFAIWHIQKFTILNFCTPSQKLWKASSETKTWYICMTFCSLLLIVTTLVYIILSVPTSKTCGPFSMHDFAYEVLISQKTIRENKYLKYISWATKPGVVTLLILVLFVRIYYIREKGQAQNLLVEKLREKLIWERKDKEFLLRKISKITDGQWQYQIHEQLLTSTSTIPRSNHHVSFDFSADNMASCLTSKTDRHII